MAATAPAPLKFGLVADIHHDVMHDGIDRLTAFLKAMEKVKPEFVLQLGDFSLAARRHGERRLAPPVELL